MGNTHIPAEDRFNAGDRRRLQEMMRSAPDRRVYQRAHAVLLVAEGWTVAEAASLAKTTRQSVYHWVHQYLANRTRDSLIDRSRSGRPSPAEAISEQMLDDLLKQSPMEHGYMSTGWTAQLLADHFADTVGVMLNQRTLRRRLHALGWRWKRPAYVFTAPAPNQAQVKGGSSAV
jgi:transposase